MIVAEGTKSCSISSRFGPSSPPNVVTPVMLLPGRFRLATSPVSTGLDATVKTIGIFVVADRDPYCTAKIRSLLFAPSAGRDEGCVIALQQVNILQVPRIAHDFDAR
jgi:hypothetical protein